MFAVFNGLWALLFDLVIILNHFCTLFFLSHIYSMPWLILSPISLANLSQNQAFLVDSNHNWVYLANLSRNQVYQADLSDNQVFWADWSHNSSTMCSFGEEVWGCYWERNMDYWTAVMVTLSLPSLTGIILVLLQYFLKNFCGHCLDSGGVLEAESSHGTYIMVVSIYQELVPLSSLFIVINLLCVWGFQQYVLGASH